jgi:hypothetical protein
MTDLPQTAVPPQVAAALTALVQALAPAAPSPSAPATGQPEAVPTVSEAMPPHTGPTPEAPPRFSPAATLAESFADPAPTLQDGVLDAIPAAPAGRIRSRKLWTMVGTVATLVVNNAAGLELSPLAQGLIAGVAGVYIIVQAAVDSVRIKK